MEFLYCYLYIHMHIQQKYINRHNSGILFFTNNNYYEICADSKQHNQNKHISLINAYSFKQKLKLKPFAHAMHLHKQFHINIYT